MSSPTSMEPGILPPLSSKNNSRGSHPKTSELRPLSVMTLSKITEPAVAETNKQAWPSWFGGSEGDDKLKVLVQPGSTKSLAYISTPPGVRNIDQLNASFETAGKGVTAYWIDSEL